MPSISMVSRRALDKIAESYRTLLTEAIGFVESSAYCAEEHFSEKPKEENEWLAKAREALEVKE